MSTARFGCDFTSQSQMNPVNWRAISTCFIIRAMSRQVLVHFLPSLFQPQDLVGGIAVIIDVLRASTTIVHALANGAKCVFPCGEVDEAKLMARSVAAESGVNPNSESVSVLLGGERAGVLIEGFDLDNNPFAYSRDVVDGKAIIFTTSNGTRALLRSEQAERILIGAFVNLNSIVRELVRDERPVHLVCAGTLGKITIEDCLCAGAIVDEWLAATGESESALMDDQLRMALDLYRQRSATPETFRAAMREGFGGRNCIRLGFAEQIERAATRDLFDIVPEYDRERRSIVKSGTGH